MQPDSSTKQSLYAYWGYAKQYPRYVLGIGALLPITLLVHQFLPQLVIAAMLSKLSKGQYTPDALWDSFGWMLVLYAVLRMTSATFLWRWVIIMLDHLEANVLKDIANRTFRHLLSLSPGFHGNQFSGSLVSQTTKYMSGYVRLAESFVMQILPLVLAIIFTMIILLPKAPHFVMALLVFCTAYAIIIARVTKKVRVLSSIDAQAQSEQIGHLADILGNIMTVKSFAATRREHANFLRITEKTRQKTLAHTDLHNKQQLFFSSLTSGITSISVALAIASVVWFDADIAVTFLVLDYSTNIVAKLWSFSAILRDVNRAFGEAHDMTTLLQLQPDVTDPLKPQRARISNGAISFADVAFSHPDAGDALFTSFTTNIKAGEKIGLVGRSGAGKTTLIKLLMRFSDVDAGDITIDGQSIRTVRQDDLRKHIAYVPQEPALFHRSIYENIAYGRKDVTRTQVVAAARKAHAHQFITKLPDGYDTLVGERGVKLSGGQRQRIAIARAILKDAPILVLDEATSALDSESEALIQKSLTELMKKRTAIVIAHRLSTIQKMDRIIVMEDGAIIEEGPHEALVQQKGTYHSLWQRQSGGFIED